MEIYNWFLENVEEIFSVATAVIAAASLIAALTPTPKDDSFLAKAKAVVNFLAINVKNAKPKQ
jgi:hypothetical protein